ncbi:type I-B CRISPR-associated protein Cas7/Csh2 [Desulfurobacterium atlanticum]|uniref:CRISPR-associated protein Csh2 n=1 Tax=Desulfurobacterium atlanticum TaxID=240169 RepID=A0A239A241_9BACT|nr:type I-B CRISPR-associated protein Cas7/Csh2 [Desulfurobacterium atlanticum]SNR89620.1 CRISPR-associated protein Csh2 [Desulfurobacterium atlanticum]
MIKNRREYLFFYDVTDANPNGDPMDENRPRIDEEVGICFVTDTRLKRVIRDELADMGEEIFIREERKEDGKLKTKEELLDLYNNGDYNEIIRRCIDIRLFGGTFAVGDNAKSFTGPVQFKFGRSLHKVSVKLVKGTTVMPSKEGKGQGTMTDFYIIPYGLFCFYGIANEKAAKDTELKDDDLKKMTEAMWKGIKESTDVISRSKFGHMPRLLIEIIYKENTKTHMGELNRLVSIKKPETLDELAIRDIEEIELDFSKLKKVVEEYKDKIEKIYYAVDKRLKFAEGSEVENIFEGIPLEKFPWLAE